VRRGPGSPHRTGRERHPAPDIIYLPRLGRLPMKLQNASRLSISLCLFVLTQVLHAQSPPLAPPVVAVTTGPLTSIWTKQDRLNDDLFYYPDMPIGVIRTQAHSHYLFFAPGTGLDQATQPNGEYVSAGTLDQFAPAMEGPNGPVPSMMSGLLQPAPDGDYDRDYAGGGPIYVLSGPEYRLRGTINDRDRKALLVLLYHGEYHPDAGKGLPFYGVSALAVSGDHGKHFVKIGEILAPHSTLEETIATGLSVTADGAFVEADENGYPVAASGVDPDKTYVYCLFSDRAVPKSPSGFSLARVRKKDFVDAVLNGHAPVFRKYYLPSAADVGHSRGDFFTEPGIGGNSTFVVTQPGNYIATPQIHFAPALHKFVLVYPQNQNSVWIRFADNLFEWSAAQPLYVANDPHAKVFYASAVGRGHDPTILGSRFYVYFVTGQVLQFQNIWTGADGTLVREEVTVDKKGS
jgi:hypothetical protein